MRLSAPPRTRLGPASAARTATANLLSGHVVYRALVAAFWVALARFASPGVVGELAIANSLSVPIFVGLDAGINQYLVREFDTERGFPSYLRHPLQWRSCLVVLGCTGAALGTGALIGTSTAVVTGILVGAGYGVDFMCQAWLAPDRARLNMRPDRMMKLIQGGGSLAALFVIHSAHRVDPPNVAAGVFVAYLAAAVNPWRRWVARRCWHDDWVEAGRVATRMWKAVGVFAVSGLLTAIYTRMDDLAVQVAQGTAVVAGYTLAYKFIESARLPSWAVTRVVLASASSGEESAIGTSSPARAILVSIWLALGAALGCSVLGPGLAGAVLGAEYHIGGVLQILAVSVLVAGFTAPAQGFLLGVGDERSAAVAAACTFGVMAGGLIILTPTFGSVGAAWCVVGGESANALFLHRALRRHELRLGGKRGAGIAATGFIALLVAAVLPSLTPLTAAVGLVALWAGVSTIRSDNR
jgi:O-antigen/teichoic acid export membrane protein